MSYPHDYYDKPTYPHLHNRGENRKYFDPDYIAHEADDQLPILSTMGRGPRGEGLQIVYDSDDTSKFYIYSTLTGEKVYESPVLMSPTVQVSENDYRTLVPGEPSSFDIRVTDVNGTSDTTVYLPAGQPGSLVFLYPDTLTPEEHGGTHSVEPGVMKWDGTFHVNTADLYIYNRKDGWKDKPKPRVNDIVYGNYLIEGEAGFLFGTIEAVEGAMCVFTARTFVKLPPISISANNTWVVNGTDTGVQATGAKGDKGDKGDAGPQGERGLPGKDGKKGDKGDKGDTGPQGLPGQDGRNGKDGKSFNLGNVTTVTGEPETQASAEFTLVDQATNTYDLTLTLPAGKDGIPLTWNPGVWDYVDLPPWSTTPVNSIFVVRDEDRYLDLYIRGEQPVEAELGGPWVVIEDILQLPPQAFQLGYDTVGDVEYLTLFEDEGE